MEMKKRNYETSDICLAAYLFCSGTPLSEIDRKNPLRCIFVFDFPKPDLLSKWQEGKATANVFAFYNSYQVLKARIYRGDK
jgi:hypothetical protein